ncbi:hypothetical protein C8R45DRAFT_1010432 [Mycena sanguinolenta]|nr:hypothetical protein C8R45DRAFT_1010432 [Mycena sanguinolenta]
MSETDEPMMSHEEESLLPEERHVLQQQLLADFNDLGDRFEDMRKKIISATSSDSPTTKKFAKELQEQVNTVQTKFPVKIPLAPRTPPPAEQSNPPNTKAAGGRNAGGKGKKPESKQDKQKTKDEALVVSRVAAIRQECNKPAIEIPEYEAFVEASRNTRASGADVEDAAFVRVFRGYALEAEGEVESADAWCEGLQELLGGANWDLEATIEQTKPPVKVERRAWLVQAERNISEHASSSLAIGMMNRAYLVLTSIEFVVLWDKQNDLEKDLTYSALFIDQHPRRKDFQEMSPVAASKAVNEKYFSEFAKWKKKYGRDMLTPRRKLAEVYANTGLHMLLDSYWCPSNLVEGHRTREWVSVWEELRDDQPVDGSNTRLPLARYEGNRSAAHGVLRALNPALETFARAVFRRTLTKATRERQEMRLESAET